MDLPPPPSHALSNPPKKPSDNWSKKQGEKQGGNGPKGSLKPDKKTPIRSPPSVPEEPVRTRKLSSTAAYPEIDPC